jgi:hypothetical protein
MSDRCNQNKPLRMFRLVALNCAVAFGIVACGGGGSGSVPDSSPSVLTAGSSYTMVANNSVMVPAGTTVDFNGTSNTIQGANNTFNTSAGAVVNVPSTATGPSDNTVTTE